MVLPMVLHTMEWGDPVYRYIGDVGGYPIYGGCYYYVMVYVMYHGMVANPI
jgi:hypothetical protein